MKTIIYGIGGILIGCLVVDCNESVCACDTDGGCTDGGPCDCEDGGGDADAGQDAATDAAPDAADDCPVNSGWPCPCDPTIMGYGMYCDDGTLCTLPTGYPLGECSLMCDPDPDTCPQGWSCIYILGDYLCRQTDAG